MYIPKHFEVNDKDEIISFINANSFGQLISESEGKLVASHLPFLISEQGDRLICHLAKRNNQWKEIEKRDILITFQGEHDYVSPSWYETTGVPTWNYQAVHVYGDAKLVHNAEKLKKIVSDLTNRYESSFENPWMIDFKESLLDLIVGVEVTISDIQCKYKVSQNRSGKERLRIAKEHGELGLHKLSEQTMKDCT